MLQEEQIFAGDLLALVLRLTVLRLLIALDLPIVVRITVAIVAEAGNFLSLADWCGFAPRRVQVLTCLAVLKSNLVAALDRLARAAVLANRISLFDREKS